MAVRFTANPTVSKRKPALQRLALAAAAALCLLSPFATAQPASYTGALPPSAEQPQAFQQQPQQGRLLPPPGGISQPTNASQPAGGMQSPSAGGIPQAASQLNFPGAPDRGQLAGQPAALADQSPPPAAEVARALTGAEPLRPPRDIRQTSFWSANANWLIPAIVLIALAVAVSIYVRQRLARRPVPVDPRAAALSRIEAAASLTDDKLFAIAVSDAVRYYLEAHFHLRASGQTTEEFLQSTRGNKRLPTQTLAELAVLLELCDLAKFARAGLTSAQREALSQTACQLIGLPDEDANATPNATAAHQQVAAATPPSPNRQTPTSSHGQTPTSSHGQTPTDPGT